MKTRQFSLFMALVLMMMPGISHAQPTPPSGSQWQLVFNDDFNTFNTNEWGRGSTPWGSENQSSCNLIPPGNTDAWVSGGNLTLRARAGSFTGASGTVYPYTSGWAWMKNWRTYGYIEIQASFPTHQGAWPAFWMLGDGWPPEFDVAEWRGAPRNYMTTAFYNGTWYTDTHSMDPGGWHTYGIDWEPNYLRFYIDGQQVFSYNGTTPSQPMYVILSNGTDCNDGNGSGLPSYFNVSYVRWYQLSSSGGSGGITSGQTYRITARNSGRALDANGTANNSPVQVYDYWGGSNQQWMVQSTSGGYYRLTNVSSGRALDAAGTANNSQVQIYDYWGGNNQQWAINSLGSGYYSITNRNSGRALDVGGTANNSPVQIYDYWGGQNQQFQFTAVSGSGGGRLAVAEKATGQPPAPEDESSSSITVFPNPSKSGHFIVRFPPALRVDIELMDTQGKVLLRQSATGGEASMERSLPAGMYIVHVTDGFFSVNRKFVVQ